MGGENKMAGGRARRMEKAPLKCGKLLQELVWCKTAELQEAQEEHAHNKQYTSSIPTNLVSARTSKSNYPNPTHKYNMEAKPSDNANFRSLQFPRSNDATFYLPFPSHIPTPVYEPCEAIHSVMYTHCTYFSFIVPWIVQSKTKQERPDRRVR